jgi:hypothetical protein
MKFSYVLIAVIAADFSNSAIATPQRLRTLQESMSMAKADKDEMSVHSKATKLFKPAPSKAAKAESMSAAEAKSGKAQSMPEIE